MSRSTTNESSSLRIFGEDEILRILYQHNPWWTGKPIPPVKVKPFRRRDYYKIKERVGDNKILALVGPRQVGKTTLMYQLIQDLLNEVKPREILFLSLDDPFLSTTQMNFSKIFELYATNIRKQPLNELTSRSYILLDEIQTVKNWESMLKRYFDLGYNIKFIVTGSSSVSILDGASEALVGRIYPQIVFPMKFLEYLRFKEDKMADKIQSENKKIREALGVALKTDSPEFFYNVISTSLKELLPFKDNMLVRLNEYVIKGGYPETANFEDLVSAAQYIGNYLRLTIYKDIIRTKKVRDPISLENLFTILSKLSSQIINRVSLAKTLGLKKDTLNAYVYVLKTTFLVSEAEFFSESRSKRVRKEKKVFINDIGIRNVSASTFDEQILTNETEMGRILETVVADHTRRLRFNLEAIPFPPLFYWKDHYEVDLIINPFNKTLPIEVKYREGLSLADLQGLRQFSEKFKYPMSFVITKDKLDRWDNNILIPSWLYLISC